MGFGKTIADQWIYSAFLRCPREVSGLPLFMNTYAVIFAPALFRLESSDS